MAGCIGGEDVPRLKAASEKRKQAEEMLHHAAAWPCAQRESWPY